MTTEPVKPILHDGALREARDFMLTAATDWIPTDPLVELLARYKAYELHKPTPQEGVSGQEPVAWRWRVKGDATWQVDNERPYIAVGFQSRCDVEPLFAHPAPLPSHAALVEALTSSPHIEEITPSKADWDACETVQDTYNMMKRKLRAALAAITASGSGEGWLPSELVNRAVEQRRVEEKLALLQKLDERDGEDEK